jgi:methyltransferase
MSVWWIFGFYFIERGVELVLAQRNRRIVLGRGGVEFAPETYRAIVAMHVLFFVALVFESWPWKIPLDALTLFCLLALILLQGLRYWCISSLGERWNTRILVVPGEEPVNKGPYRFMRHPNYVVVVLEFAILPLLMRAPLTLIVFSLANLVLLSRRIRLEEKALRESAPGPKASISKIHP